MPIADHTLQQYDRYFFSAGELAYLSLISRDVSDIRFRFRLAGYPAIFSNPVPAPVPAKMVPGTGYLSRIMLGPFCAFRASLQHCRGSRY